MPNARTASVGDAARQVVHIRKCTAENNQPFAELQARAARNRTQQREERRAGSCSATWPSRLVNRLADGRGA